MTANGQIIQQQQIKILQQELQNELTSSNQLLRLIYTELQLIKQLTSCDGELEKQVVQNATLMEKLANIQMIDLRDSSGMEVNCVE